MTHPQQEGYWLSSKSPGLAGYEQARWNDGISRTWCWHPSFPVCGTCRDSTARIHLELTHPVHPSLLHSLKYLFLYWMPHPYKTSLTHISIFFPSSLFHQVPLSLKLSFIHPVSCWSLWTQIHRYIHSHPLTYSTNIYLLNISPCQAQVGLTLERSQGTIYPVLKELRALRQHLCKSPNKVASDRCPPAGLGQSWGPRRCLTGI